MAFLGGILGDALTAPFKMLGLDPSGLPLVGGIFPNDNEENYAKAFEEAKRLLEERDAAQQQARMNMIQQGQQTLAPMGKALETMYGPQVQGIFDQAYTNPMAPTAATTGTPAANAGSDWKKRIIK